MRGIKNLLENLKTVLFMTRQYTGDEWQLTIILRNRMGRNKTNNFIRPGKNSFIYSLACCSVQNYVYRRISVTYGWQILRESWPYLDSVTICWIIKQHKGQIQILKWINQQKLPTKAESATDNIETTFQYEQSTAISFIRNHWRSIGIGTALKK